MEVRPIDGNALIKWFSPYLHTGEAIPVDVVIEDIRSMPTFTPPNEPLTLEQLREMKDKPAYLNVFDPLLESGWHIIKAVTEDKIIFRGWQTVYVPIDGMGIDYNLYRRPPEGEVDGK